jgi:hypothetical protein
MNALLGGLTYANGPWTLGAEYGVIDSQGDGRLVGVSQRHEYEIAADTCIPALASEDTEIEQANHAITRPKRTIPAWSDAM